jgi:hypothetical protein
VDKLVGKVVAAALIVLIVPDANQVDADEPEAVEVDRVERVDYGLK